MSQTSHTPPLGAISLQRTDLLAVQIALHDSKSEHAAALDALLASNKTSSIPVPVELVSDLMGALLAAAPEHVLKVAEEDDTPAPVILTGASQPMNIADVPGENAKAIDKIRQMDRDDLMAVTTLPNDLGVVAYFSTDRGLRAYGQMSLIQGLHGWYGIVIDAQGNIPRDAGAGEILNTANRAARKSA